MIKKGRNNAPGSAPHPPFIFKSLKELENTPFQVRKSKHDHNVFYLTVPPRRPVSILKPKHANHQSDNLSLHIDVLENQNYANNKTIDKNEVKGKVPLEIVEKVRTPSKASSSSSAFKATPSRPHSSCGVYSTPSYKPSIESRQSQQSRDIMQTPQLSRTQFPSSRTLLQQQPSQFDIDKYFQNLKKCISTDKVHCYKFKSNLSDDLKKKSNLKLWRLSCDTQNHNSSYAFNKAKKQPISPSTHKFVSRLIKYDPEDLSPIVQPIMQNDQCPLYNSETRGAADRVYNFIEGQRFFITKINTCSMDVIQLDTMYLGGKLFIMRNDKITDHSVTLGDLDGLLQKNINHQQPIYTRVSKNNILLVEEFTLRLPYVYSQREEISVALKLFCKNVTSLLQSSTQLVDQMTISNLLSSYRKELEKDYDMWIRDSNGETFHVLVGELEGNDGLDKKTSKLAERIKQLRTNEKKSMAQMYGSQGRYFCLRS